MKTRTISSFFLLSVLVAGMVATTPPVFADHPNTVLEPLAGSATAGCEQTDEGCYNMPILTVAPGTTITFSNTDNAAHTLTSGSPADGMTGVFDSGLVLVGATYEFTIDEEGEYSHYCLVHPWMIGQIIVEATHGDDDTMMGDDEEMMDDTMMDDTMMGDDEEMMDDTMMDDASAADEETGGCLIATAAFGSELAPQVQQLRELRDNTVLATESGTAFMSGFNSIYYTFSPAVADLERENPAFRETVKVALTPMLSTLSLLNHADIDTETEMLGYGISVVLLNLGMYVGIPAFAILKCTKLVRARLHTENPQNR
ncbi:MAG: hypothetical protein J4F28_01130 [Nitrosopumilaceae archaeon]|nr:hypothetical protein [Nitrosopumilaceae archaeon]